MMSNSVEIENRLELERILLENENSSVVESGGHEGARSIAKQFEILMMQYAAAIREVRTKLEVFNDEFKVKRRHNPIRYIKYRVKKPASIHEKLLRRGFPVSLESIEENMHDVAGVRVVCGYVQDIYTIAGLLTSQDDVVLLQTKDYIKNPKENGYRSLHLVIEVPVFFSDMRKNVKVEVQIRTISMDYWASLEHQINYKTDGDVPPEIVAELRDVADVIAETNVRMQAIYNALNPHTDAGDGIVAGEEDPWANVGG